MSIRIKVAPWCNAFKLLKEFIWWTVVLPPLHEGSSFQSTFRSSSRLISDVKWSVVQLFLFVFFFLISTNHSYQFNCKIATGGTDFERQATWNNREMSRQWPFFSSLIFLKSSATISLVQWRLRRTWNFFIWAKRISWTTVSAVESFSLSWVPSRIR